MQRLLIILYGVLVISINGCGAGSTGTASIIAGNPANCGGASGQMNPTGCTIPITYNTGGVAGLSISCNQTGSQSSTPIPINFNNCNPVINSNFSQSCNVTISYAAGLGTFSTFVVCNIGTSTNNLNTTGQVLVTNVNLLETNTSAY